MTAQRRPTRRAVLVGAVAAVAAACRPTRPRAAPPPDDATVRAALADELTLLAGYDALMQSHPALRRTLRGERVAHEEHLSALRALVAVAAPTPTTAPSAPSGDQKALRHLLAASARRLSAAAVAARSGTAAAVLASIAASHQTLAQRVVVSFTSSVSVRSSGS